jgi:energy-coupling factor transporter ATP-binding protein EcfA2
VATSVAVDYDLFVAYATTDRAWVEGYLLDALAATGLRCYTAADFDPGMPQVLAFERAVQRSQRSLLVLSPDYLANGFDQFANVLALDAGLRTDTWPVVPLILRPVVLPPRLEALVSLDATEPERWPLVIERLCQRLRIPPPPPAVRPPCPYPGMRAYTAEDRWAFWGREQEIEELRRRVRHQNYLFVIGPSGSGKSSLVSAGLAPTLQAHEPDVWRIATVRPGATPLAALATTLGANLAVPGQTWASRVDDLLARSPSTTRLLLIVDQLEELFTLASKADQSGFIAALEALRQGDGCVLVLTMRADFYPDLMNSALWPLTAGQRLEIAPLRSEALREALARPAERLGVRIEPELIERLLVDAADEPGVLPLLQETMVLLWERLERRLLPLRAYEALGLGESGLAVALVTTADAALAVLPPARQPIARRIILSLIQLGEGRADTRRQQSVVALRQAVAAPDAAAFDATVRHLADRRLITIGVAGGGRAEAAVGASAVIDLAHEAMIGAWPQLRGWLQDREMLRLHRRLTQAATEWQAAQAQGRADDSFLYGRARLVEAQRYAERFPDEVSQAEHQFLAASAAQVAAQERSRYLGQAAGGAVGAALGYGLAFTLGFLSRANPRSDVFGLASLTFLAMFAVGQLAGFGIGLALWWYRHAPVMRVAAAGLIGALVSGVAYALLLRLVLLARTEPLRPEQILAGALLGAGIGLAAGLPLGRQRRLLATMAGGVLAAGLAVLTGGISWQPVVTVIAGLLLGTATGLGFQATAVEPTRD